MTSSLKKNCKIKEPLYFEAEKKGPNFIATSSYGFASTKVAFAAGRNVCIANSSGLIERRYSTEYEIQKIMWATFYPTKDDKADTGLLHCLAIIGAQNILFANKEKIQPYTYSVSFKIRNVYQTKFGLLIEQDWSEEDEFRLKQKENVYLFSLTHPLNELLPVLYKPQDFIGQWLFCWERDEFHIVDVWQDTVIIRNRAMGQFQQMQYDRILHLRRCSREEIKSSVEFQRNTIIERRDATPLGPKFSTPKTGFDVRTARTRSIPRFSHNKWFLMDSPALSNIGTPPSLNSLESPYKFRSSTQISLFNSMGHDMTKILARDMNNDLFYAEFCLEPWNIYDHYKDTIPEYDTKERTTRSLTINSIIEEQSNEKECLRNEMIYEIIGGLIQASETNGRNYKRVYTYSPKIAQFLLAIAVGLKTVVKQVDIQRFLGHQWKSLMPIGSSDEILKNILSKKHLPEEKFANLLKLFGYNDMELKKLPCVLGLVVGQIISKKKSSVRIIYPQPNEIPREKTPPTEEIETLISIARWNDKRLLQTAGMLQSDEEILVKEQKIRQKYELSHDAPIETNSEVYEMLYAIFTQRLSRITGRALKEFRECSSLVTYKNETIVPDVSHTVKILPAGNFNQQAFSEAISDFLEWGEFYNGIAAALRIGTPEDVKLSFENIQSKLKKDDPNYHRIFAGLFYGFTLNGHVLGSNYQISEMLSNRDPFTSISVLLSKGIMKLGTADKKIEQVLLTILPDSAKQQDNNLLPDADSDLIQSAAIFSYGLLYAQTADHIVVNRLLNEIGNYLATNKLSSNKEVSKSCNAYRLNVGFSIGLINLGLGSELISRRPPYKSDELPIEQCLINIMLGYSRKECSFNDKSRVNNQSSPTREISFVNVQFSGRAACAALTLMFLQTNNKAIASKVKLSENDVSKDKVNPELILPRVLCYNLIMWNDIKPTIRYVIEMTPTFIEEKIDAFKVISGKRKSLPGNLNREDQEALCKAWCCVIAGTCMAIGIKYKNSSETEKLIARKTILFFLNIFLSKTNPIVVCAGIDIFGSYVTNTLITSLGILMAGTGDIECLRLGRYWRANELYEELSENATKQQEYLTAHQLLGLTFLGNGRYVFKEDLLSNALLYISFFPDGCQAISDNRFYLQPLRFLWTLAVESRLIVPYTKYSDFQSCKVHIKYKNKDRQDDEFSAPCLIPSLDFISQIQLISEDFTKITYDLDEEDQKKEFSDILKKYYGKIKLNESIRAEKQLTYTDFNINSNFQCEQNRECDKITDLIKPKVFWPDIETTPYLVDHIRKLEKIISDSLKNRILLPELKLAFIVANWANAVELYNLLEVVIDTIDYNIMESKEVESNEIVQ